MESEELIRTIMAEERNAADRKSGPCASRGGVRTQEGLADRAGDAGLVTRFRPDTSRRQGSPDAAPANAGDLTICPTELARMSRSPARIGPTQSIRPFLSLASR